MASWGIEGFSGDNAARHLVRRVIRLNFHLGKRFIPIFFYFLRLLNYTFAIVHRGHNTFILNTFLVGGTDFVSSSFSWGGGFSSSFTSSSFTILGE